MNKKTAGRAATGLHARHARADFAAERAGMARESIPSLIELLASADLRTRFLAEMCLRDATGT